MSRTGLKVSVVGWVVVVLGVANDSSNQIELFTDIEMFLGGGWWWW